MVGPWTVDVDAVVLTRGDLSMVSWSRGLPFETSMDLQV